MYALHSRRRHAITPTELETVKYEERMSVIRKGYYKMGDWELHVCGFSLYLAVLPIRITKWRWMEIRFCRVPVKAPTFWLLIGKMNTSIPRQPLKTGAEPKVLYYLPEFQVMVLEFIHGTTMLYSVALAAGMPKKIAEAIKRLHGGPRFLTDFNMFRLTEFYLDISKKHDVRIPCRPPTGCRPFAGSNRR